MEQFKANNFMGIFSNLFIKNSQNVEIVKSTLFLVQTEYEGQGLFAIKLIVNNIIEIIKKEPEVADKLIVNGLWPQDSLYRLLANRSGDMVESGEFHVYRGSLNLTGQNLILVFDFSINKLLKMNVISSSKSDEQKNGIRERIKYAG